MADLFASSDSLFDRTAARYDAVARVANAFFVTNVLVPAIEEERERIPWWRPFLSWALDRLVRWLLDFARRVLEEEDG